jgi:hypothetical protein
VQRQALLERVKLTMWIGKKRTRLVHARLEWSGSTPWSVPEPGRAGAAPRGYRWDWTRAVGRDMGGPRGATWAERRRESCWGGSA